MEGEKASLMSHSIPLVPIRSVALGRIPIPMCRPMVPTHTSSIVVLLAPNSTHKARRRSSPRVVAHHIVLAVPTIPMIACKQWILDLPHCLFAPHAELQILLRDRVPVLIHHHHRKEDAHREEEEPVDVVLYGVANSHAESEQENLCNGEKRCAEQDIADWPAIFQGADNENKLKDDVNSNADEWPEQIDDPQSDGLGKAEPSTVFERCDRNKERKRKEYE